ncbi:MAG: acyltransferase family protein [Lacisediminihabitans sp.]
MSTSILAPTTSVTAAPSNVPEVAAGRLPGLDGLRAFAVSAVMLYHLSPGFAPGGYLGVDIFFVISGFLITGLLLREKTATGSIHLGDFWRRRARRLLPALGILLLVCCSAAWIVGGDVLVDLGRQVLGAVTFSSNWLAIANDRSYFDETAPELFRNLWSLAVEEQFYLVWPFAILMILVIRLRWLRLWLVAALGVASAIAMALLYVPGTDATRVYYGTDTHSFGLAIGAVLAILSQRWSGLALDWPRAARVLLPGFGLLAIAGLVAAAILLPADAPLVYQGGLATVALLTAVAIMGAVVPGSLLGHLLDLAPIRWVGERSYGLYLWHWPAFILVTSALPGWPRLGASGWALGGIALAITVVAATLSYRYIEQPIRRRGFRAAVGSLSSGWHRSWRRVAAVTAVTFIVAGTGLGMWAALTSDPVRSDAETQIERGQAAIAHQHSEPAPEPSVTATAPLPGGDQITAIGDSVMLASAPELQTAFPGIQIDAVVSRQMVQLPGIIQDMLARGTLRPTIVIGLGTNGPINRASLEQVRQLVGPRSQIVLVNVQAPRGWTDGVDSTLALFAQQYRDVELANWRDAIAGQLNLLARDQIHPGPRGGLIYAGVINDALQRLAELPPLLEPNDYGLAPRPL